MAVLCLTMVSCTKDKTDYEAEIETTLPEYLEFKQVVQVSVGGYSVSVEAVNGEFYQGYNEVRLKVTGGHANITGVTLLPILTEASGDLSAGPHSYDLVYVPDGDYFSGYAVFISESGAHTNWELYIGLNTEEQAYSVIQYVEVSEQANKNLSMAMFTGKDGKEYVIALVSPQQPRVGENELVVGIYQRYKLGGLLSSGIPDGLAFSYAVVNDYTLLLDPRMPEPSMGNHSSPNNEDLIQEDSGLYRGVVNYTMTGNWTLNFILLDQQGQVVKGTVVPDDFTPGVVGEKSELYIDILF